ncbi:hypothetical protein ABW19_dt0204678 [Dactylella cylindrospora]|nr:hypothetical protein ABW19_dt0204678 [Dactylella cylindrospora]
MYLLQGLINVPGRAENEPIHLVLPAGLTKWDKFLVYWKWTNPPSHSDAAVLHTGTIGVSEEGDSLAITSSGVDIANRNFSFIPIYEDKKLHRISLKLDWDEHHGVEVDLLTIDDFEFPVTHDGQPATLYAGIRSHPSLGTPELYIITLPAFLQEGSKALLLQFPLETSERLAGGRTLIDARLKSVNRHEKGRGEFTLESENWNIKGFAPGLGLKLTLEFYAKGTVEDPSLDLTGLKQDSADSSLDLAAFGEPHIFAVPQRINIVNDSCETVMYYVTKGSAKIAEEAVWTLAEILTWWVPGKGELSALVKALDSANKLLGKVLKNISSAEKLAGWIGKFTGASGKIPSQGLLSKGQSKSFFYIDKYITSNVKVNIMVVTFDEDTNEIKIICFNKDVGQSFSTIDINVSTFFDKPKDFKQGDPFRERPSVRSAPPSGWTREPWDPIKVGKSKYCLNFAGYRIPNLRLLEGGVDEEDILTDPAWPYNAIVNFADVDNPIDGREDKTTIYKYTFGGDDSGRGSRRISENQIVGILDARDSYYISGDETEYNSAVVSGVEASKGLHFKRIESSTSFDDDERRIATTFKCPILICDKTKIRTGVTYAAGYKCDVEVFAADVPDPRGSKDGDNYTYKPFIDAIVAGYQNDPDLYKKKYWAFWWEKPTIGQYRGKGVISGAVYEDRSPGDIRTDELDIRTPWCLVRTKTGDDQALTAFILRDGVPLDIRALA